MVSGFKCVVPWSEGWWCWVKRHGELWLGTPSWIQLYLRRARPGQRRGQNALRFWNAISYDETFKGLVLDPEATDRHGMTCSDAAELVVSLFLNVFLGTPMTVEKHH